MRGTRRIELRPYRAHAAVGSRTPAGHHTYSQQSGERNHSGAVQLRAGTALQRHVGRDELHPADRNPHVPDSALRRNPAQTLQHQLSLAWARMAAPGVKLMTRIFSPFSKFLVGSTSLVNRVVTKQPVAITTDDLSQALELTAGTTKSDKEILEGILRYGDTEASAIMTPRIDITDLSVDLSFDQVMKTVIETGFSRIPVYENNQDNIRGILFSRDLLPYIGKVEDGFDWTKLLREPYFVPESRRIDDLLEDFRTRKQHLAIVVDEYGGTQGIVTLEDVLEEIVGDIDDEYDQPELTYKKLRDNTYEFEGRTLLTDFFRITGLNEDDYKDMTEDAETLAECCWPSRATSPRIKSRWCMDAAVSWCSTSQTTA